MKTSLNAVVTSALTCAALVACASSANAQQYQGAAASLGATWHAGIDAGGIAGKTLTTDNSGYQLTPFETTNSGFDYTLPSPMGLGAGDERDFHWVHETSGPFAAPQVGSMWSFGATFGDRFMVNQCIDHSPIPEEGLETQLWGSNDGGQTWLKGVLTDIYEEGWTLDSVEDGATMVFTFDQRVNMISATAGLAQGNYSFASDDSEIDAVLMVPTPGALGLLGVSGLLATRRRR